MTSQRKLWRGDLPGFVSRRGFLALAGSLVLPSRAVDIAHFPPSDMFRGNHLRTGFYETADVGDDARVEMLVRGKESIVASPLLVEDLVCFGYCTVRSLLPTRKQPHRFVAVDKRTGRERWGFEAEKDIVSSAAYYDDTILVGGLDGGLYARDLDGHPKWRFQAEGGIFTSPAVYDGHAYFASGDMEFGRLYCLDIKSRRLRWPPVPMLAGPFASPCVAGGNVFLGTYWNPRKQGFFYVVDAHTGEPRKEVRLPPQICHCSTPASDGETVYCVDCGEWERPSVFWAWDARAAEEKWQLELDADNVASSIALAGHLAIFGCDKGHLFAVNTRTQRLEWKSSYNAGAYHGSPCVTPRRVYIGSMCSTLDVFDHHGNHLKAYEVGGNIESTPVARDAQLFFGCNDGGLYRLTA
ncbi:MAG TPA: PQQ-binding-like beta-propeller repeat protein [Planctomycetota bacterium]|nr:PQQ-binding-like beta-propeller repeat protein [Planctomycetota bacterium]